MAKLFKEYQFQVIDYANKKVIYTDNEDAYFMNLQYELLPISMRKKINDTLKGFKIITE